MPDGIPNSIPAHGGATVDLQGGRYAVNGTLWLGSGENVRMCCGSLLASADFQDDSAFLLSGGHALQALSIIDVEFDMQRRGAGAMHFDAALRVHLDRVYVHHYVSYGVQVVGGHEVHVSNSWFGEWAWSEGVGGRPKQNLTGTALEIDGQDHWLTDIVVFSGLQGIVLHGGASVLTNTHIYNGGTGPALVVDGSKGAHAVKVTGSYFDFNRVVLLDPVVGVDISHSMFLGGVGVAIQKSKSSSSSSSADDPSSSPSSSYPTVDGLSITQNQFIIGAGGSGLGPNGTEYIPVYALDSNGTRIEANCGRTRTSTSDATPRGMPPSHSKRSKTSVLPDNGCGAIVEGNAFPGATYGPFLGQSFQPRSTVVRMVREESDPANSSTTILFDAFGRGTRQKEEAGGVSGGGGGGGLIPGLGGCEVAVDAVSIESAAGFPVAVVRPASPSEAAAGIITIETSAQVLGTVTVTARLV